MQFKLYMDVHDFYRDTYEVLMRHEAQNMIPLGNIIIGHQGKDKTDWRPCKLAHGHYFRMLRAYNLLQ
ncbi:hypothetical protein [Paenibacillus xylanexedens]|uniref:hypothetical protein n=1 Tax=Paenibacillus xylanexedens TaxID=528191 RepID=UPI003D00208A